MLRTEALDGQTYYVISEMPSHWPPPPPHFIAGKKLRWEGTQLMEHRGSGEQAILRFDGADETGYEIHRDGRVTILVSVKVYARTGTECFFSIFMKHGVKDIWHGGLDSLQVMALTKAVGRFPVTVIPFLRTTYVPSVRS